MAEPNSNPGLLAATPTYCTRLPLLTHTSVDTTSTVRLSHQARLSTRTRSEFNCRRHGGWTREVWVQQEAAMWHSDVPA